MYRFSSCLLLASVLLAGCVSENVPQAIQWGNAASSLAYASRAGATVSSDDEDFAAKAEAKIRALPTLFRDNERNYVVIFATLKDKKAANDFARDNAAWVLPTDLTSTLSPGQYAVVLGPFSDAQSANDMLKGYPYKTRDAYVKDAGKLRVPTEWERYASRVPPQVLVAFAGRMEQVSGDVTLQAQWEEEGGVPCIPVAGPVFRFKVKEGESFLLDSYSPRQIAAVKERLGEPNLPRERLLGPIHFWLVEQSGEIAGPRFCFD